MKDDKNSSINLFTDSLLETFYTIKNYVRYDFNGTIEDLWHDLMPSIKYYSDGILVNVFVKRKYFRTCADWEYEFILNTRLVNNCTLREYIYDIHQNHLKDVSDIFDTGCDYNSVPLNISFDVKEKEKMINNNDWLTKQPNLEKIKHLLIIKFSTKKFRGICEIYFAKKKIDDELFLCNKIKNFIELIIKEYELTEYYKRETPSIVKPEVVLEIVNNLKSIKNDPFQLNEFKSYERIFLYEIKMAMVNLARNYFTSDKIHPYSIFFLKPIKENNGYRFKYIPDANQLLLAENQGIQNAKELLDFKMPINMGVCGIIARTKAPFYCSNWEDLVTLQSEISNYPRDFIGVESKILAGRWLFGFPIIANGSIAYIVFFNGTEEIPFELRQKLNLTTLSIFRRRQHLFERLRDLYRILEEDRYIKKFTHMFCHSLPTACITPIQYYLATMKSLREEIPGKFEPDFSCSIKMIDYFMEKLGSVLKMLSKSVKEGRSLKQPAETINITKLIKNEILTIFQANLKRKEGAFNFALPYEKIILDNLNFERLEEDLYIKGDHILLTIALSEFLNNIIEEDVILPEWIEGNSDRCIIEIVGLKKDKFIEIEIIDYGKGMNPLMMERLNNLFRNIDEESWTFNPDYLNLSTRGGSHSGTGLITSAVILRSIVNKEGKRGRIFVKPTLKNSGTTFKIVIPENLHIEDYILPF